MKLVFLGTRGEIEARTRRHRRHTSLEVSYRGRRIMVDAGEDWLGELDRLRPHAVVITHAHPDHAWGLKGGAPCPVHATGDAWKEIADYPIRKRARRLVTPRSAFLVEGIRFEAFTVEHSVRAPAVGYRITAGRRTVFYAPDLVYIHERKDALAGVDIYIGDGATTARSLVRRRGDALIGHAPVRTQLGWCQAEGVPEAIITHCGAEIVAGDERALEERLKQWGRERSVWVTLAHDGMERLLR
jgi:phosphoribosyl 1,2-cyclic phosphodiesterase